MNEVVVINDQEVVFALEQERVLTDSLTIAKVFEKRHDNVIRAIESLPQDDFTDLNFEVSEYIDGSGKRNKMYKMTRDGFMMLAMGFTGEKAYEWKKQYIEAFNRLEQYYYAHSDTALPATHTDLSSLYERLLAAKEQIITLQARLLQGDAAGANRTAWSDEEDSTLLHLRAKGLSYATIGKQLGRSRDAVRRRYRKIASTTLATQAQPRLFGGWFSSGGAR